MKLAKRGSRIGSGKNKVWVKEIRKSTKSGHQTSIVSTAYGMINMVLAVLMFARWCQENFFNYMMKHFAIDLLSDYGKQPIPDAEMVISPKSRTSRFGSLTPHPVMEDDWKAYEDWLEVKADLAEEICVLEATIKAKKEERWIKISEVTAY